MPPGIHGCLSSPYMYQCLFCGSPEHMGWVCITRHDPGLPDTPLVTCNFIRDVSWQLINPGTWKDGGSMLCGVNSGP